MSSETADFLLVQSWKAFHLAITAQLFRNLVNIAPLQLGEEVVQVHCAKAFRAAFALYEVSECAVAGNPTSSGWCLRQYRVAALTAMKLGSACS